MVGMKSTHIPLNVHLNSTKFQSNSTLLLYSDVTLQDVSKDSWNMLNLLQ
jgi:hypothetical protein